MRFASVILTAVLCLPAWAQNEEKSDEALLAAAEQLIAESENEGPAAKAGTETATVAESKPKNEAELKESEIPVLIAPQKAGEEKGNSIWRMVASLAVIALTAGIGLYASRRWSRGKDKGGQKARIEMMHQFHLGPRKSLALVRVSGEALLIGITDHNINMLKSVALIDDELEHIANKDFNGFLEDEFSIEDVRGAITRNASLR